MDSVNPNLIAHNLVDENENPTGGYVMLVVKDDGLSHNALTVNWQNGPRGLLDGTLAEPNGAFVEDVIFAAKQRLEFFQESKFKDSHNEDAINYLQQALDTLQARTKERSDRGVEGTHEV